MPLTLSLLYNLPLFNDSALYSPVGDYLNSQIKVYINHDPREYLSNMANYFSLIVSSHIFSLLSTHLLFSLECVNTPTTTIPAADISLTGA